MLPLPRKPKAGGFETGGRVFSAGLPSVRDPVCLAAELVLLKGCWKGPEPGTAVVMFVWLKEEPAFVEGGKKKERQSSSNSQTTRKKMRWAAARARLEHTCVQDLSKLITKRGGGRGQWRKEGLDLDTASITASPQNAQERGLTALCK